MVREPAPILRRRLCCLGYSAECPIPGLTRLPSHHIGAADLGAMVMRLRASLFQPAEETATQTPSYRSFQAGTLWTYTFALKTAGRPC
jgi:hypothetical protein